jgi:hypothetical protein
MGIQPSTLSRLEVERDRLPAPNTFNVIARAYGIRELSEIVDLVELTGDGLLVRTAIQGARRRQRKGRIPRSSASEVDANASVCGRKAPVQP